MAPEPGGADRLSGALGHVFQKAALLEKALTHRGYAVRCHPPQPSNERLEFLGDRVLGLVVADLLLRCFPQEDEGEIARRYASLVRRDALAEVAEQIGLAEHLMLEKGEERSGGRHNPTILADALEAVIAALYLDGGLAVAAAFVERQWTPLIEAQAGPPKDVKSALQEWVLAAGRPLPVYRTLGQVGPDHEPVITVEVAVEGLPAVRGSGSSRRAAEQAAAKMLLMKARQGEDG
jgi:ribonuclease-3